MFEGEELDGGVENIKLEEKRRGKGKRKRYAIMFSM